ncbi:MAG: hypothetical protein ABI577_04420 [bacterium]
MPSRFLALALIFPLLTGCTLSARADASPAAGPTPTEIASRPQGPVEAARFRLEKVYGQEGLTRVVSAVSVSNSVLVITMVNPPTDRSTVDEYWRVCRTLSGTTADLGIAAGQTALVVIQPNGTNVVYAVAGESACKVA